MIKTAGELISEAQTHIKCVDSITCIFGSVSCFEVT